jgi:hypothetical protein
MKEQEWKQLNIDIGKPIYLDDFFYAMKGLRELGMKSSQVRAMFLSTPENSKKGGLHWVLLRANKYRKMMSYPIKNGI